MSKFKKKLKLLAAALPPVGKVVNGKPVMVGNQLQLENHHKNILRAWETGGRQAVEKYVSDCNQLTNK